VNDWRYPDFTKRRLDPGLPPHYQTLTVLGRIYLDQLAVEVATSSLGLGVLQL